MAKKKTRRRPSRSRPRPEFMTLREVLHDIERKIPYAIFWNRSAEQAWKIEDLVTAIDLEAESLVLQLADALRMHPEDVLHAPVFTWGATAERRAAIAIGDPQTGTATTLFVEMGPDELEPEEEFGAGV